MPRVMVRACCRKVLTIAVFAGAFLPPVPSQDLQSGVDAVQPREMKALLAKHVKDQHLAGMGAIVIRAESVVGIAVAGVKKRGEGTRISPDDIFHLGSNTKAITTTMIARLIEAGKLSFATTPLDVFPELRDTIHPDFRRITIEQLLSHHAGIPAYTKIDGTEFKALPQLPGNGSEQRARFATWVLQHAPANSPGTKGLYSNAGVSIAAAMAERITGSSWEKLVTSEVLEPLGMHAIYGYPLTANRNEPWGHVEEQKELKAVDLDEAWQVPPYLLPAGGMAMSLSDYGRFLQMNLNALRGTETRFLSVATVRRLHSSTLGDEYALGWGTFQINGVRSSTHAGSGGSFYALVTLQPGRDVGVAVFANSAGKRTGDASDIVINALLARYALVPQ